MTKTEAAAPVIRLSAVAYTYAGPPPVRALRPTDLVIRRGEHVAITGPSGSGKSTLLNLLGLLDRPTEGTLEIDGIDVGSASERDRAAVRAHRIGFVFQSFHLLPHRTSAENVMLAQVYADLPRRRRPGAAMAALAQVGLEHRAHALPTALSGGERQRVAIARALVNHPSLLLCDEPTGNLDTATTRELIDLLGSLHAGGTTLVIITHNPAVAESAERRVTIRDGQLAESPDDGPGEHDDGPGEHDARPGGPGRQEGEPGRQDQRDGHGRQDDWPGRQHVEPGRQNDWPGGRDGEHETRPPV
jgi:putative ABC transport system ATP-binding protein